MSILRWVCIALSCSLSVLAIPPADFGFPNTNNQLSVTYQVNGSAQLVQPGILFGINGEIPPGSNHFCAVLTLDLLLTMNVVPSKMPQFAVSNTTAAASSGEYMLFMLDPDASYPQAPCNRWIIHYWQMGVTRSGSSLQNTTAPRAAYRSPAPPTNSSAHRYIQYLFEQPAGFQVPAAYAGYNQTNYTKFPFESFVADAGLGAPVAANYFYCSNETAVPANFVAPPGGTYPGGNGAMITEGPSGPATSSSAPSSTSSGSPAVYTGSAQILEPVKSVLVLALTWAATWSLC